MVNQYNQILGEFVQGQYGAAIEMLRLLIEACPQDLWDNRQEGTPFWHIAYHTIFYLDFYLGDSKEQMEHHDGPAFHFPAAQWFAGEYSHPPYQVETPEKPFSREQIMDYLSDVREKAKKILGEINIENLTEKTAFYWLDQTRGDTLLYNLRHVQHHVGQLYAILKRKMNNVPYWQVRIPL